jgi:hypothetical protein
VQKGFASRPIGKTVHTWVFRKEKAPFESNVESVGSERDFYVNDGDFEADTIITDKEPEFSMIFNELRAGNLEAINKQKLGQMLVHFQTRTKWFREVFTNDLSVMLQKILECFQTDEYSNRFVDAMISRGDSPINKQLDQSMPLFRSKGLSKNAARKLMYRVLRNNRPALIQIIKDYMEHLCAAMPKIFQSAMRKGHINSQKKRYNRVRAY